MSIRGASRFAGVSYAIRDVLAPARALERDGHEVLHLNIGDPCKYDLQPPPELVEAAREGVADGRYMDSEGLSEARRAIAAYESSRGIACTPDDVVVTTGTSEALGLVASSILDPGDEILIPGPAYPPYVSLPLVYNARAVAYPTRPEDGWLPDPEIVRGLITERTRALVLISPNNPTGAVIPRETLRALAELAWEQDLLLVSDDIYGELYFGSAPPSAGSLQGGPVLVLNGLSKSFLVPGWRAGYMVFHDPEDALGDLYETVMKQARLRLSAPGPMQHAIAKALRPNAPHLAGLRRTLAARARVVVDAIAGTDALDIVAPEGAFYAFVGINGQAGQDDKSWVLDLLDKEKVLCVPGSGFGAAGKGHFRMVFLPPEEVLEEAMTRIVRHAERVA